MLNRQIYPSLLFVCTLVLLLAVGCNNTLTPVPDLPSAPTATPPSSLKTTQIIDVGGTILSVALATTLPEQEQGLSGIPSLNPDQGMLFMYDKPRTPSFWMKDMQFPLDIIWIKDQEVIGITPHVPVPTTTPLPTYRPPEPIDTVLEVQAGWAASHHITRHTKIKYLHSIQAK